MERCGNGFPGLLHQYSAQQAPRADQPQDIGRKPAEINQTNAQDWHQPQRECATNENWCAARLPDFPVVQQHLDRKSTRLNSSHQIISYAVFRLKKKQAPMNHPYAAATRRSTHRARRKATDCAAHCPMQPQYYAASAHGRCFFFFNDTATTEIYTLSLHDALPI